MTLGELKPDFGSFYLKYAPLVRRVLARRGVPAEDLDDVVQEAFITIQRLLPKFEGRSSLETWLHSVTWRVAAKHRRRARYRYEVISSESQERVASVAANGSHASLHAHLGAIEDEQRDVLALHDIGGFSISDLSKITGRARFTVRERLNRARNALSLRMSGWSAAEDPEWIDRLAPGLASRIAARTLPGPAFLTYGGSRFSALDDTVIAIWSGETSAAAFERLLMVAFGALHAHPRGICFLNIIEPTSQVPSREVRQLHSWAIRRLKIRAAGWSIEDRGMISLVAPVMNACMFVAGVPLNVRFFDSLPPAAAWVASYGATDAIRILQHVKWMRSQTCDDRRHYG